MDELNFFARRLDGMTEYEKEWWVSTAVRQASGR